MYFFFKYYFIFVEINSFENIFKNSYGLYGDMVYKTFLSNILIILAKVWLREERDTSACMSPGAVH